MFPGVFGEPEPTDDDLRKPDDEPEEDLDEKRRYAWTTMLYVLAEGRLTEYERVLTSNAMMCFTHLAFERGNKQVKQMVKGCSKN